MASSTAHPSFPTRPYASNLGKLPDRTSGAAFGASTTQAHREAQRLERERERAERERLEREGQNQLAELTEEQREEINEAVGSPSLLTVFPSCRDDGRDMLSVCSLGCLI